MKQTRKASFLEACFNIIIGYAVAIIAQVIIFPRFGIYIDATSHLAIGALFTVISLVRSYVLRRWFEVLRVTGSLE